MKRITVMRMLKQRLSESKQSINTSYRYEEMVSVMGGDDSKEKQHRINMDKDIRELEICINALENSKFL